MREIQGEEVTDFGVSEKNPSSDVNLVSACRLCVKMAAEEKKVYWYEQDSDGCNKTVS